MNNRTKKKEPLLRVENLTTQFKINEEWFSAVQEISFSIARSQVVGIIGESGCGKSVTAASLLRLLPARKARIQQGKFFFKGQEISHLSMDEFYPLRGKEISMIFQDPLSSLNPVLKIKEQLLEVWEKSQREVAFKKVKNLLHQVGLGDSERILQSYPHQLSGGMRQRIMIAMNNGPVGSEIYDILTKNIEWLEDEKIVYIQKFLKSDWKNTFSRIFSKQNADENHLSIMGKEVLDKIFVEFGNKTPNELIDLSHEFHAWKKHNITNSDNLSAKIDMIDLFENDGCLKVSAEDIRCAKIAYEH